MRDCVRNKESSEGATDTAQTSEQRKGSPDQLGNAVDGFRTVVFRNELDGCSAQAQIEDAEIAQSHEGDGEDAITVMAEAADDDRNGDDADDHRNELAGEIEGTVTRDQAAASSEGVGHQIGEREIYDRKRERRRSNIYRDFVQGYTGLGDIWKREGEPSGLTVRLTRPNGSVFVLRSSVIESDGLVQRHRTTILRWQ